jgi:hypothetical protein
MNDGPDQPFTRSAQRAEEFEAATQAGIKAAMAVPADARQRVSEIVAEHGHSEEELGSVLHLAGLIGVRSTIDVPKRYGSVLATIQNEVDIAPPAGGTVETK